MWITAEVCLTLIFLWSIESLAVAMLPMRFLDGKKVMGRSRALWAFLLLLGMLSIVHFLLAPNSGYVGNTEEGVRFSVMVLFAAFAGAS